MYYESTMYNVSYEPLEVENHPKTKSNCSMHYISYQTKKGITINHIINYDWTILKMTK